MNTLVKCSGLESTKDKYEVLYHKLSLFHRKVELAVRLSYPMLLFACRNKKIKKIKNKKQKDSQWAHDKLKANSNS